MRSMQFEFMPRSISRLSPVNMVRLCMFDFVCCVVMMIVVYMILGWLGVVFTLCSQCHALGQALSSAVKGEGIWSVVLACCLPTLWILP